MRQLQVWAPNALSVELVDANKASFAPPAILKKATLPYLGAAIAGWWQTSDGVHVLNDGDGYWFKLKIAGSDQPKFCIDPYARAMQNDTSFSIYKEFNNIKWNDDKFRPPAQGTMVIYEIFQGAYMGRGDGGWTDATGKKYGFAWSVNGKKGDFVQLRNKLDYIQSLGVNTIELLPVNEYKGDDYIGYDSVSFFAIESSYAGENGDGSYPNGPGRSYDDLKAFINDAHGRKIAVIADVVFNHIGKDGDSGPLWCYDSNTENIYFSDENTQYGRPPDWGSPGVQKYIEDACHYYLDELHFDGLRFDDTAEIINKNSGAAVLKRIVTGLKKKYPAKIFICENWPYSSDMITDTKFDAGWFNFRASLQSALEPFAANAEADLAEGIDGGEYAGAHSRVIYANNHDECWWDGNNDHPPSKYWPVTQFGWRGDYWSQKKSRMMSALSFFVPGIPLFFMGDEFAMEGCFNDAHLENIPNWALQSDTLGGQFTAMFKRLIQIRQTYDPLIQAENTLFDWLQEPGNNWFAFKRKWNASVLIVAGNWSGNDMLNYSIPTHGEGGTWTQVFNSDGEEYGGDGVGNFDNNPISEGDAITINIPKNGIVVMDRASI